MDYIDIDNEAIKRSASYVEYKRRIEAGEKGGVALVFLNGKTYAEVEKKTKLVTKIVDALREFLN